MRRDDRGAVTAELALALPLLLVVTTGLVWLLSVGMAQVRVVDAARETARAAARGDNHGAAVGLGERVGPEGVRVGVAVDGQRTTATASARVEGPGGLFRHWAAVTVTAEAVAATEQP